MRYWVQFLHESTGYIAGTIPPQFGKPELIDACGGSAVFILDGRNSAETMRRDALKHAQRMQHYKKFEAFQIVTGGRLFDETRRGPVHRLSYPISV